MLYCSLGIQTQANWVHLQDFDDAGVYSSVHTEEVIDFFAA